MECPQGVFIDAYPVAGDLPASVPRDRGVLAAVEAILAAYRAPDLPDLPPLQSGLVGYLGYDVVREIERLPNVPRDDLREIFAQVLIAAALTAWPQEARPPEARIELPGHLKAE